jgi:hypothetical protein
MILNLKLNSKSIQIHNKRVLAIHEKGELKNWVRTADAHVPFRFCMPTQVHSATHPPCLNTFCAGII